MVQRSRLKVREANIAAAPHINFDTGAANSLQRIAGATSQIASFATQEFARQTARDAQKAGRLAGAEGTPDFEEGNTIYSEAFNTAAANSFLTRTEADVRAKLDALSNQYANDPVAYEKSSSAYLQGILSEIGQNEQTSFAAPLFESRFALQQQGDMANISRRATQDMRNRAVADIMLNERLITSDFGRNVILTEQQQVLLSGMLVPGVTANQAIHINMTQEGGACVDMNGIPQEDQV